MCYHFSLQNPQTRLKKLQSQREYPFNRSTGAIIIIATVTVYYE